MTGKLARTIACSTYWSDESISAELPLSAKTKCQEAFGSQLVTALLDGKAHSIKIIETMQCEPQQEIVQYQIQALLDFDTLS